MGLGGDVPPKMPGERFIDFINFVSSVVDTPVTWFRESVVVPNRPEYYWYHRKFRRVPTIDTCYRDDIVCYHEAHEQYTRDRRVDNEILNILRSRKENCYTYENPDSADKCKIITEQYLDAEENWYIKYGELGAHGNVRDCYMKQKHRLIWERRHGPVGSGMRPKEEWATPFEKKNDTSN